MRKAVATTTDPEATSGQSPAPHYRPGKPGKECSGCGAFRVKDGICTRFGFVAEPNYVCDGWVSTKQASPEMFVAQMRANLPIAQTEPIGETPIVITKEAAQHFAERGQRLAHFFWGEVEKIATAASMGDAYRRPEDLDDDPPSRENMQEEMDKEEPVQSPRHVVAGVKPKSHNGGSGKSRLGLRKRAAEAETASPDSDQEQEESPDLEEESPPAHGIVGTKIDQLDERRARGIPIIQPPPGFVFEPELQAFKPDPNNPGWMLAEQAGEATQAKKLYDQGAQDATTQQAQQQLDQQVDASVRQQLPQGQGAQQTSAKPSTAAKAPDSGPPTPASISGADRGLVPPPKSPSVQNPKKPNKKGGPVGRNAKGAIKIEIGR